MTDQLRMTVQQCEPGRSGQPTHRLSHEPTVEHLLVLSQAPPSGVGEPHQSAAAIGGVRTDAAPDVGDARVTARLAFTP